MPRTFRRPFPNIERQINALGQRLRNARLRRGISTILFASRVGVSRDTLNRLEKGDPNIALGTYVRALRVLGLDKDLDALARDDELGRKLQDLNLSRRNPKAQKTPSARESTDAANLDAPARASQPRDINGES
jgi:transcriptional regulator with XRE-family HTH domain